LEGVVVSGEVALVERKLLFIGNFTGIGIERGLLQAESAITGAARFLPDGLGIQSSTKR
jgi:hypothetical protein